MADETSIGGSNVRFRETLWTVVVQAQHPSDPHSRSALESLLRTYWKPIYFFVRRKGFSIEDAKDLTQQFLALLLERGSLGAVDRARGKFRTFLLASLENFLSNERDRTNALKRGGGTPAISLDIDDAELTEDTPERAFNRAWALTLLRNAIDRLREDCEREGRSKQFEALRRYLTTDPPGARDLAQSLGVSEGDIANYLHRMRRRLSELVGDLTRDLVLSQGDLGEELRELAKNL